MPFQSIGFTTVNDLMGVLLRITSGSNRGNTHHPYVQCYGHQNQFLGFIDRSCWEGLTGTETAIFLFGEVAGTYQVCDINRIALSPAA